jgi:hypothetical protein
MRPVVITAPKHTRQRLLFLRVSLPGTHQAQAPSTMSNNKKQNESIRNTSEYLNWRRLSDRTAGDMKNPPDRGTGSPNQGNDRWSFSI